MKTLTTTYKTRNGEGTVVITRNGSASKDTATFDGLEAISISLQAVKGVVGVLVNLKDLHNVGFNAPNVNQKALINLPEFDSIKELREYFHEDTPKGKICNDGIWRTYEDVKGMNYSEKVLAGEYTE